MIIKPKCLPSHHRTANDTKVLCHIRLHIRHVAHRPARLEPRPIGVHRVIGYVNVKRFMWKTIFVCNGSNEHFNANQEVLQLRRQILVVLVAGLGNAENILYETVVDEKRDGNTLTGI